MPTDAAKKELEVSKQRISVLKDSDTEFADENERTSAFYTRLKPELDSRGFVSSHIEATHKFCFNKSCYLLELIVIFLILMESS